MARAKAETIKWKKFSGEIITTNTLPATVKKAKELGWEEVKKGK